MNNRRNNKIHSHWRQLATGNIENSYRKKNETINCKKQQENWIAKKKTGSKP